jgi:hypothetical protein
MPVINMTNRPFASNEYCYTESIGTGATGSDIRIPPLAGKSISIALIAGASTGKFQVSTSSDAAITAGTATWSDLTLAAATGTVRDEITASITGLRGVSTSGAITIEVVI